MRVRTELDDTLIDLHGEMLQHSLCLQPGTLAVLDS